MGKAIKDMTEQEVKERVKKATKIENGKLTIEDEELVSLMTTKAGKSHGQGGPEGGDEAWFNIACNDGCTGK